jgi:membrane-bound serine protease (ClpP class)
MDYWIWPILLLVLGLGIAFLEIFFPTGGILAFFSGASLLAAILLGFRSGGPGLGLTVTSAVVIGVPLLISLAFRIWPRTAVGKAVLLDAPRAEDVLPDDHLRQQLKRLIGRVGKAKCRMLPSGVVLVDGQTLDAMSEGMVIEAGQTVRVIKVEAKRLVVRAVEEEIPTPAAENPLERPIDTIADDPFGEPLV